MEIEGETRRMREYNVIREREIEAEAARLREEIEGCEREIGEIKMERVDMQNHIKMSQKVKKSKNSAEIAQGQTLIFET
jgi:hypothetical protein